MRALSISRNLLYPLLSVKRLLLVSISFIITLQTILLTGNSNLNRLYQMSFMGFTNETYDLITIVRITIPYIVYVYYLAKVIIGQKAYHHLLMNRLTKRLTWWASLMVCQISLAVITGLIYFISVFGWLSVFSLISEQSIGVVISLFIAPETLLLFVFYFFSCICLGSLYTCIQSVFNDGNLALIICICVVLFSGVVGAIDSDVIQSVFRGPIMYFNRVFGEWGVKKSLLVFSGQFITFTCFSYYQSVIKGR